MYRFSIVDTDSPGGLKYSHAHGIVKILDYSTRRIQYMYVPHEYMYC